MSEHVLSTNTPNGLRPQSAPGLAGPENAASRRSVFGTASPSGSRGLQRRLHDIRWRLLGVALLGCLAAVADGLLAIGTRGEGQAWLRAAIVAGLIGAGALAFTLRGRQRMGVLLLAGGVVSALWMLNGASAPLPFSVGVLFTGFGPWVCAYLSLAYPTGRLRSQAERTFLALTGCGSLLWLLAILTQAQPPFRTRSPAARPTAPTASSSPG